MIDRSSALLLARYRMWADQSTFDAVGGLPAGEAEKERPNPLGSMIGTLNHIYLVDLIWQAHLEGRDHGFASLGLALYEDLSELREAQREVNQWFIDWVSGQSAETLDEAVCFRFIGGEHGTMTRGEILLHVINHATYHRGWIADMFFRVPARNPTIDLPVYLSNLRRSFEP